MLTIHVNAINLNYEVIGKGEPLIFIIGLIGDLARWKPSITAFAEEYQVISFDNRGVGLSDKPDVPYSINIMAQDCIELMNSLHVERAHIIGLSMGGQIAQVIASQYPERVKSLVLTVASARFSPDDPERNGFSIKIMRFLLGLFPIRKVFAQYPATRYSAFRQFDAFLAFDSRPWLDTIRVPVLILNGTKDKSVSRKDTETLAHGIPDARLKLFDGDHLTAGRNPDVWVKPALKFLKEMDESLVI